MTNRILFFTCLLFISFLNPNNLFAQNTARVEEKVTKMTALVHLNAEQQKQYKALLISNEQDKNALLEKVKTVSAEEKKSMQQAFKTNYENQLRIILTAAQFNQLKKASKDK